MNKNLILMSLIILLSCSSDNRLQSEPLVGIFTMPVTPLSYKWENIDLYKDKPRKITHYLRDYNLEWEISFIEVCRYEDDYSEYEKRMHLKYLDAAGNLEKYYVVDKFYDKGKLIKQIVTKPETGNEVNRKELQYHDGAIDIDVFFLGEIQDRYTYIYSDSMLLKEYSNKTRSAFSGEWEESFSRYYFYDDENRLTRISDSPDLNGTTGTVFSYLPNGDIQRGLGQYADTIKFNNGRRTQEIQIFTPGGEYDKSVTTFQYTPDGKLKSMTTEDFFEGKAIKSSRYIFEY